MSNYANYPGHGLTQQSRDEWKELEARQAVENARQLIEWARAQYVDARNKHRGNLRMTTELTLNWNPQRVLSRHGEFVQLARSLNSETAWKMLNRKERKFIADAVKYRQ